MGLFSWLFGRPRRHRRKRYPVAVPVEATIPGPGEFGIQVVGESFHQRELEAICGGINKYGSRVLKTAVLILEDENPHDPKAVRVEIDGLTVGHLSRANAREYRRMLADNGHPRITASCRAIVMGGWDRGDGDNGMFGVRLDLPTA